jgi:protein tyrosine phosphatase
LPQLAFTQVLPLVQSIADVAVVQVILQAPVPHWYGVQGVVVAVRQVPIPSHDRAEDSVEPVQLAAPQGVLAAYFRHAPLPSHLPSVPHEVDPMSVHCVAGVGAVPAATGTQVPVAQVLHVAAQPVLQQMPPSQ